MASCGLLKEETSAKVKSQPFRQGAEPCTEACFAMLKYPTGKWKDSRGQGGRTGKKEGRATIWSTENGTVGASVGPCAGVLS